MAAGTEALSLLDDEAARVRIDRSNLLARIDALPDQCDNAWRAARDFSWPKDASGATNVVVFGIGGSAIAGDILRSLSAPSGGKPISVVRGYDAPAYVGKETFVVACSHSGDTDETLAALKASLKNGARAAVITTGGRLADVARQEQVPAFIYTFDGQPRCALGYQLMALLALGECARVLPPQDACVTEALSALRSQRADLAFAVPSTRNAAKQLATRLHQRVPVMVGTGVLGDAAHRWKTQMNENAKSWAFWDELPEMDHNSVVGFGLPPMLVRLLTALFLLPEPALSRDERRYQATADELSRAGVTHERIDVGAESPLAQVLSAIYLGDYVSYYLALLNEVDPTPIDPIARVKARLGRG